MGFLIAYGEGGREIYFQKQLLIMMGKACDIMTLLWHIMILFKACDIMTVNGRSSSKVSIFFFF